MFSSTAHAVPAPWARAESAWNAAATLSDIAFLIDRQGLVVDYAVQDDDLATSLTGRAQWRGLPWARRFTPDSHAAIRSLLGEDGAPRALGPLLARHAAIDGVEVPVHYRALMLQGGEHVALLGRNLLGYDFLRVALLPDARAVPAYTGALLARGTSPQALCLDLLAPTARRLGQAWMEDRCSHTEVMDATWRLSSVLRDLPATPTGAVGRSILLAAADGEQHVFGLEMTAAFFRWAGWEVTLTEEDPLPLIAANCFSVAGVTLARADDMPTLRRRIERLRQSSLNRRLVVLVGGAAFLGRLDLASGMGADAAAGDAADAVRLATILTDPAREAEA